MAFKREIVYLVVLLSEIIYLSSGSDFFSRPQILTDYKEYVIDYNENHTVLCQGNRPLQWTTPEVGGDKKLWTKFKTVEELPSNKSFKYALRLYITNMSYPFVGFYNCHFQNTTELTLENENNTQIYLYYDDPHHLSVYDIAIEDVYVTEGKTALLPCKPTSPDVHVELMNIDSLFDVEFDNKIGFSFSLTDISQLDSYICHFSRQNETKDAIYNLELSDDNQRTIYLPIPSLSDENKGHTTVGDTINLKCIELFADASLIFSWKTPLSTPGVSKRINESTTPSESVLKVSNVTLADSGVYTCIVADRQNHRVSRNITINVFEKGEHVLNMWEKLDTYSFQVKAGAKLVTFVVDYFGHPQPKFTWYNNSNGTIPERIDTKYEVQYSFPSYYTSVENETIILRIKNIDIHDFGHYTLVGSNKYENKRLDFFLNVTDKPSVDINASSFHLVGKPEKVQCIAAGHPTPNLQWKYKPCLRKNCELVMVEGNIIESEGLTVTSEITINANESGLLHCTAWNALGSETDTKGYIVTDVVDGFEIKGFDDTVLLEENASVAVYAVGEKINVICAVSTTNYSDPTWLLNGSRVYQNERIKLNYTNTNFSNSTILQIENSNISDSGTYTCKAANNLSGKSKELLISVEAPRKAQILDTNMNGTMEENFPKAVTLRCSFTGLPKPQIHWYKDGVPFSPTEPRIRFESDKQILRFSETKVSDAGSYKCEAVNKHSRDSREVALKFKNAPGSPMWLICLVVFLVIVLLVVVVYLAFRVWKERKFKRELNLMGLDKFEKGAVENINPELGIDDQAELLPYDRKWEFPIEHLKLGKQLGSGAFGVVLKGEAKYIVEGEPLTTVAVKMVKKNADNTYIKALASELKIMAHLGKHLNVVNLLGACTKNVVKRELLVIVEYCRFGNLQNYLLRHREDFVDQIDPKTGLVNYLIGQDLLDRTYSVSSNWSQAHSPLMKYAKLAFSDSANNTILPCPSTMGDYRAHPNADTTDMTSVSKGEDGFITSSNSVQPQWRSNYKGDYKGQVNPISTKDLIAYAFQISRGMEYLASRKVLHGDLAARNILLTDENIVKICDFGLAKSIYKNDNYKKRGDCPLPVKWMAIESIRDRVFSTQSDVWSFGIVLWEIFSLGRTPYPGMEADERLYHKLVDGYRLENPEYSPKEIYQIMTECWSAKPLARPSFTKLTERIGALLEDTLRKHYVDLNDPYLAMNTKMMETQSDYLAMLSPPTYEAIASPHYVNDIMTQQPSCEDGYMSMKPNTIFSPRVTDDEVFDFAVSNNRKNTTPDEGQGHELLPMLRIASETDSESPLDKCDGPTSISNPTYHLPPTILNNCGDNQTEIVKSEDNYVNMPQNKCLIKDKSAQDYKPNMIIDDKKGDTHHYVNELNSVTV